jgi:Restriction Endonuclease associating with ARP
VDFATSLRNQLRVSAAAWATKTRALHYRSLGKTPTILFEPTRDWSAHGNFNSAAWKAICADPTWSVRLEKPHPQKRTLPATRRDKARELDSSNSSDALLMNCFCYPGASSAILRGLGLPAHSERPVFGFRPGVRLLDGTGDETEIDMKIGDLTFEAKLTEKDFTSREEDHVRRYEELASVFDIGTLPTSGGFLHGYQLIRNVLAAAQLGTSFIVLLDQRRPDLVHAWWDVHCAITCPGLRRRCIFRTWQEVAASSPPALRRFLDIKYGIHLPA